MIVEGAAGSCVSSGGALARTRKNYAQQTASRVNNHAHTFSERYKNFFILSLIPSVLMIVINTAHKVVLIIF